MLFFSMLRLIVNFPFKRRYYVEIPQLTEIGHLTLITSNKAKPENFLMYLMPA